MQNDSNDEIVTYNYNLVNNSEKSVPATTIVNFNQPIVDDGRDRFLTCLRFVLDGSTIPIFFFKNGAYWITITVANVPKQRAVQYINFTPGTNTLGVFSYFAFVEMINKCIDDIITLDHGIAAGSSPIMVFLPNVGVCNIYYPTLASGSAVDWLLPGNRMFFNNTLYQFFGNYLSNFFGEGLANKQDWELLPRTPSVVVNTVANATGYILLSQEYSSVYNWFDITAIVFQSQTLGVTGEYYPTPNVTSDLSTTSASGNAPSSSTLITDFQPYYAPGDIAGPRGYLYYAPSVYRLINIQKNEISSADISIKLRDRVGHEFDYYLPANQSLQIKISFLKKSLYKDILKNQ